MLRPLAFIPEKARPSLLSVRVPIQASGMKVARVMEAADLQSPAQIVGRARTTQADAGTGVESYRINIQDPNERAA